MEATTAADYLEKHKIYGLFEDLMQQLIIHKPEDPLDFLITQLNKPPVLKVIIAGPPASGKGTQCELVVNKYGLVHVSTGDLLRDEVRHNTELGKKVKQYLDNGALVPDDLINSIVFNKLNSPECQSKGWLLDGYPRTKAQALSLQSRGIFPDKCVLLTIPDEIVVDRVDGRRIDPITGLVYHLKFNPPPVEQEILTRLEHRSDDTAEKMIPRLAAYHTNLEGIKGCFSAVLGVVDANQPKDKVFEQVVEFIDKASSTLNNGAPMRPPKLFIIGPPGSGRRTQAKVISVKHELVLVSVPELLRGAAIPGQPNDEAIAALIKHRTNQKDCLTHGWVIAGYPTNVKQAEVFAKAGIVPSRVIHLGLSDEVARERVSNRRVDPKTGILYDTKTKPPKESAVAARLVQHPDDTPEALTAQLKEYNNSVNGIKKFYANEFRTVDAHVDVKTASELVVSTLFS